MGTEQDMEPQPPAPYVEPDPHHFFVFDRHYFMDAANMKLKQESSASSNGSSQGNTETVEEFMERHLMREQRGKADLPMKELRHIIPLLVMHCFGIKEEPGQKKVKGMWTDKPVGWPVGVPYCDPNNAMKGEGKPRKETLMLMFNFLTQTYKALIGNSSPSTVMPVEKVSQSYTMSSPSYTLPAVTDHQLNLPTAPLSSSPVSYTTTPSPANPHTILVETTPMEVTHSLDIEMPNPGTAILERIEQKVRYIWQRKYADDSNVALLHVIQDLLNKMCALKDKEMLLFYTSTHEFECTLDIVIELGRMPDEYRVKWKEFEALWRPSLGSYAGVMQMIDPEGAPEVAEEVVIQHDDESTDYPTRTVATRNSVEHDVLYTRDGPIDQLGIRTLTIGTIDDLQADGKLEVRVLSVSGTGPEFSTGELQEVKETALEADHEDDSVKTNPEIEGGTTMPQDLIDLDQQNRASHGVHAIADISNEVEYTYPTRYVMISNDDGRGEDLVTQSLEIAVADGIGPAGQLNGGRGENLVTQSLEIAAADGVGPTGQLNDAHIADAVRSMNLKSPPRERGKRVVDNAIALPVGPSKFASQSEAYPIYEPISPSIASPPADPHYISEDSGDPLLEGRGNTIRELLLEGEKDETETRTYPPQVENIHEYVVKNRRPTSGGDNINKIESFENTALIQGMRRPQSLSVNSQYNEHTLSQGNENACTTDPGGRDSSDEGPPVVISVNLQQIIEILRDPFHPGHDAVKRTLTGTRLGAQLEAMLSGDHPLILNQEDTPQINQPEQVSPQPPPALHTQASEEDIPTVVCDMESAREYIPPKKRKRKS